VKNIFGPSLLLITLSCVLNAHAALYSWIDKDGKKHFGDKVPAEYAKQVKSVEIKKTNTMDQPPVVTTPGVSKTASRAITQTSNQQNGDTGTCDAQKRAYEDSVACFSRCRITNQDNINSDGSTSPHVNNVAACGHCTNVSKPNCD
jgi:hypothetical protein